MDTSMREYNFDGLVGPTHNYAGLSVGNTASTRSEGAVSHPREAALQGLSKMRAVSSLGVGQALLPPQPRPSLKALRQLGFSGSDEAVITRAATESEQLLRLCSSASSMWTANAATCAPSSDTADGRVHLTPANLQQMFHRAIEAETTHAVLASIFSDEQHFAVHNPLPGGGQFADEGAANHTRLQSAQLPAVHLFAWGRSVYTHSEGPSRFPARQTREASEAVARLHGLKPEQCVYVQQAPVGIDGGAFHADVVCVGNGDFLMLHASAFKDTEGMLSTLRQKVGPSFRWALASSDELPLQDAVEAYPFNSQLLTLPNGTMAIIAPKEAEERPRARAFLERVLSEDNPVKAIHYLDVRQSMNNGGGPACLRQRILLTDAERAAVKADVFYSPQLHERLTRWITQHYREDLCAADLRDPSFARETMRALDELTQILRLGSVYDFQQ